MKEQMTDSDYKENEKITYYQKNYIYVFLELCLMNKNCL